MKKMNWRKPTVLGAMASALPIITTDTGGGFGILTSGSGFLIGLYLTIQKLFFGVGLADRPLLLLAVLLVILGAQFVTFGFLAEITIRNYFNAPNRQTYNIKEIVE